jgi:murein DD-endopeptidase MepM/ murein hydrolase activator NlpD
MNNDDSMKRRIVCTLICFVMVAGALPLLVPPLRQAPRYVQLLMQAPPKALPVPVAGVVAGRLTNSWGAPRSGGRHHEGIDIFARRNTPVVSATDGIVTRVGWNTLGGRIVMVTGPGGYHHYYAHLERFGSKKLGEAVRRGEVIGYVGDSGNAKGTPTHLHYGIYRFGGGAINPYPLLKAGATMQSRSSDGRRST